MLLPLVLVLVVADIDFGFGDRWVCSSLLDHDLGHDLGHVLLLEVQTC